MATGQLWVQERVRTGDFALAKVPGPLNPADILTKVVTEELIRRHLHKLGFQWEPGRAQSAPLLRVAVAQDGG